MHPRIAELNEYLDQQRAALTAAVAQIASARCHESPGAGRWSVVEVLEHVAIVERRIGQNLAGWITEARAQGLPKEADPSPILPTINTDRIVDRSRRVVTSKASEPTGKVSLEEAMRSVNDARSAFKQAMTDGDGYALTQVVRPHPALGPMHGYEWIAFVGGHMMRHALQIREIGTTLAASGGR